jgi:hypothetical protein
MGDQKMTIAEQIRDYYLLGVYLMEEERSVGLGREKSIVLDHLDNLRVRCLYLGLSGEYLLKSYFVGRGYSMRAKSAIDIGKKKKNTGKACGRYK